MRRSVWIVIFLLACANGSPAAPTYTVEEAVALAKKQNAEIAIAAKQVEAARGGVVEARSGTLVLMPAGPSQPRLHPLAFAL